MPKASQWRHGDKQIFCELCKTKPEIPYDNIVGSFREKYVKVVTFSKNVIYQIPSG